MCRRHIFRSSGASKVVLVSGSINIWVPPGPRTQTTERNYQTKTQRPQTRRSNPTCQITQIFSNKISRTESAPKTNNKPTAA